MGSQHGSPYRRTIRGVEYQLYKQYNNIYGGDDQQRDIIKLKSEGWIVKPVNITKGHYTRERATYIRKDKPEKVGNFGDQPYRGNKFGWVRIARVRTIDEVSDVMATEPEVIRKNSDYKIIPINEKGQPVDPQKSKHQAFAYEVYVKTRQQPNSK